MKRTKRFMAMLLTLILCVGEISSTGLKVFAAGNDTNDVIGEEVSDDTETVGIGTKFYINDTLPETDAYFYICVVYFEHGYKYGGMPSKIVNDKLRIPQYDIIDEQYRWYYFPGVTEMRSFETTTIGILTTDHSLPLDLPIEDCMKTIGLEVNGGNGTEEAPFTLQPIYAGSDQPYVAVILNDNLDGKLTDRFFVKNGEKPKIPEDPSIDGKVFTGWFTDKECTEKFNFETVLTDNIVLYAGWENDSSYKYDLWVGDIRVTGKNMTSIPCDSGTASYNPDKNTLTFKDAVINKGYEYSEGSGRYAAIYTKDSSLTIKGDLTIDPTVLPSGGNAFRAIYAESSEYKGNTLELDADIAIKGYSRGISTLYTDVRIAGGVLDLETTGSVVVIQDAKLDLADGVEVISPDGAAFREVTHGDTKATELFESATSDTSVTKATIGSTKTSYTVTFDMNGHGAAIDAVSVKEGKIVTEPAEPKAEGYIFGGWYTSADCKDTEKYDFDAAVTGDVTLYAKWTGVERTVTFDANGQTATEMPEAQKVENGKTATAPDKNPAAEGLKFAGWYTSKDCKDEDAYDFTKAVTGDITLYAKWEEASAENYIVTFDLNGVSGNAPEAQTVEAGKTVSKPADPKAEGFVFKTWCTDNAGEKEYDFTAPVSANFTLYAKWEANSAPGPVVIGKSSLDPVPELVPGKTKDLYLVKGQKFNIGQGWYIDKADKESKRKVSINSKTGVFKAKSEGEAVIKSGFGDTEWEVNVHISKPKMGKTLKLQLETDTEVKSEQLQFEYDKNLKVLWYSANPDVVTVDNTGKVTTVGKGTSKVTAYINGSAYSCMVKVTEKEPLLNRTLHVAKGSSKSISIKGLKNAEWEDSVKDIVSVQNNKVIGLNAGTTELSVSQNGKAYKVNVIVEDLTMKGTGLRTQGKTGSNKYIIDELKVNDKTSLAFESVTQPVVFKSSKPDVAFIDENLNVVIRGRGRTKFTAKVNGKTVTITVNAK